MIEDFERVQEMDKMYLIEARKEMEEEWERWEDEHRLPAKIEIIKTKENANTSNSNSYRKKGTSL